MFTLFHAPHSRSSRILALLDEMGVSQNVAVQDVVIRRNDGSGAFDPANPHPEAKVPCLRDGEHILTETGAIMLALIEAFPDAPHAMAPPMGDPLRGEFLSWLFWYHGVMEPVMVMAAAGVAHPWLNATFRGPEAVTARLQAALAKGPWLCGPAYSAADLLVASAFLWFRDHAPQDPAIQDWLDRCAARPAQAAVAARDTAAMQAALHTA